jgi:peptidoglycan hydrolase CwlO-like protein
MAEEISDDRFKSEMVRMMETVILKLGEHDTRFDNLEKNISEIKSDVRVIKGQFNDVAVMAIEDNKRITKLESEVEELKGNIH